MHADYISGARALRAAHGAALCRHDSVQLAHTFRPLKDGEELEVGQLRLRVIHTPGHRAKLTSNLLVNPPHSREASMVLTGDSLLVADVGRPDFGGSDPAAQYESLTRLRALQPDR